MHWTLVCIILSQKSIRYFDSLKLNLNQNCIQKIFTYLKDYNSFKHAVFDDFGWQFDYQSNCASQSPLSVDCAFICAYGLNLSQNLDLFTYIQVKINLN